LKRIAGVLISIGLWLVTASVLMVCIVLGRLFFAPIDVGFAREQVIENTTKLFPGWEVDFSEASVGWDWSAVRPWLILRDVELIDRRERLRLYLPQTEIGLGFQGVLSGVGVSTIEIDDARVRVLDIGGFSDTTDGSLFDDLFGAGGIPRPEIFIPLTEAFNRFSLRLLDTVPAFESVSFNGISLSVFRGENLSDATVAISRMNLSNSDGDLNLSAQFDISVGGSPISTRLTGRASPAWGDLSLIVALSDFDPSSFSNDVGLPKFLNYIHLPMGLSFELDLDSEVGLQFAGIEAVLGEGELYDPVVFPQAAPISYGLIGGQYDVQEKRLTFDRVDLAVEESRIQGDGVFYWHQDNNQPGIKFDLSAPQASLSNILRYWPKKFHPDGRERGARAWVDQHMIEGDVHDILFEVDMTPTGAGSFLDDSPYRLTFSYRDLDTNFVNTMPPILDASGQGRLTKTQFDIFLDNGFLMGMPVDGSSVNLSNINIPNGGIGNFDVYLRGDVKTIVQLIDHPPLDVAKKAKLDIDRLGGTATAKVAIEMPLIRNPKIEDIKYSAVAQVSDARVDDLLNGEGIRAGQLSLKVDQDRLKAAGNVLLNGVPVNLRWQEDFVASRASPDNETSLVVVSGTMDGPKLAALGVDLNKYIKGEVQAEASFTGRGLKFTQGTFSADVSTAIINLSELAWQKPVGSPATVTGSIAFVGSGAIIKPFAIKGEDIDLKAAFKFGSRASNEFRAEIDATKIGRNRLKANIIQGGDVPINVSINAETFDLAPFLDLTVSAETGLDSEASVEVVSGKAAEFDIIMNADALLLKNGEQWDNAKLGVKFRGGEPAEASLDAVAGENQTPIKVRHRDSLDPQTGKRPVTISAGNGGQVLRGLGFFAHLEGGALTFDGYANGWAKAWHIDGLMKISDAELLPKSLLSPEVNEGIISGVDDYLSGAPLALDIVRVPFIYDEQVLTLDGLKANGPTMGLTMEGQIATSEGILNVNGVVVPAYGLNSLLGNLPIVGGLFTGGDGKGLFGVAYRVKGSTSNPDVSINTMSGLAPGFLRLLFEGRKGRIADVEAQPKPPELPAKEDAGDPLDPNGGMN
jgi:hypothetical protein